MLTISCFFWQAGDPPLYTADDVFRLRSMVDRNMTLPHDWVCVTDRPELFEGTGIRPVPFEPTTHVPGKLFDKVELFHPNLAAKIGSRVLNFDLDVVITGSLDEIAGRREPVVLWRNPSRVPWDRPEGISTRRARYNASLVLITAGACAKVWKAYDAGYAPRAFGTDQDFISAVMGDDVPYWAQEHGVYRYARDDGLAHGVREVLPENARIVFFPGSNGKITPAVEERCPWISTFRA
jgi:hypothetical protein